MQFAALLQRYRDTFEARYASRLRFEHQQAIDALLRCRTLGAGRLDWQCDDCLHSLTQPLACGHRSCPRCHHHDATRWLDRQRQKLVPVDYFMVTLTLPAELRALAWAHQTPVFNLLFDVAAQTLKDFARNPNFLGAELGMTAVLHTHTRTRDFHPHLHVIVPGGGIDLRRRQWRSSKQRFLFNQVALARVFRARLLTALRQDGFVLPEVPPKWIVHIAHVGSGEPALKYLSAYLYRGVLNEKRILAERDGYVTFEYHEARSGLMRTRTLPAEDFLWLILQHVLPKGFRRTRDYGFLHGNAKATLTLIRSLLRVIAEARDLRPRSLFTCPHCRAPMHVVAVIRPRRSG